MKMLLVTAIAAFSTSAYADLDVSGCDLTSKPGYAVCHLTDCNYGEATVPTCTVIFKHRKGTTTPEQNKAFQDQIDQASKAGG